MVAPTGIQQHVPGLQVKVVLFCLFVYCLFDPLLKGFHCYIIAIIAIFSRSRNVTKPKIPTETQDFTKIQDF